MTTSHGALGHRRRPRPSPRSASFQCRSAGPFGVGAGFGRRCGRPRWVTPGLQARRAPARPGAARRCAGPAGGGPPAWPSDRRGPRPAQPEPAWLRRSAACAGGGSRASAARRPSERALRPTAVAVGHAASATPRRDPSCRARLAAAAGSARGSDAHGRRVATARGELRRLRRAHPTAPRRPAALRLAVLTAGLRRCRRGPRLAQRIRVAVSAIATRGFDASSSVRCDLARRVAQRRDRLVWSLGAGGASSRRRASGSRGPEADAVLGLADPARSSLRLAPRLGSALLGPELRFALLEPVDRGLALVGVAGATAPSRIRRRTRPSSAGGSGGTGAPASRHRSA